MGVPSPVGQEDHVLMAAVPGVCVSHFRNMYFYFNIPLIPLPAVPYVFPSWTALGFGSTAFLLLRSSPPAQELLCPGLRGDADTREP